MGLFTDVVYQFSISIYQITWSQFSMGTFGMTAKMVCRQSDQRHHAVLPVPVGQRFRFLTDVFSLRLEKAFLPVKAKEGIMAREATWFQHWWYFISTPAVKLYYKGTVTRA